MRLSSICAVFIALLGASACTSLEAVRTISGRLQSASETWKTVAIELPASCQRQQQFNPALVTCAEEQAAATGLIGANAVLTAYFKALQDAASEQNFTIQPGIESLATSVSAIPGINADEVNAVSGLAGLLARLATSAARERTIRNLIGEGGPSAKRVIGILATRVPSRLSSSLAVELDMTAREFAVFVQRAGGHLPAQRAQMCATGPRSADFSGPNFLLVLEYCRRANDIASKQRAITDYQASLGAADKALDDLMSNRTKLTAPQLIANLYAVGRELDEKAAAVRQAFA